MKCLFYVIIVNINLYVVFIIFLSWICKKIVGVGFIVLVFYFVQGDFRMESVMSQINIMCLLDVVEVYVVFDGWSDIVFVVVVEDSGLSMDEV